MRCVSDFIPNRMLLIVALSLCFIATAVGGELQHYPSKYYDLYTDLAPADVPEVIQRVARMAEEYHNRTQSFSGKIDRRFRFELYRSKDDYDAAGGLPGSGGMYHSSRAKLMAVAGERLSDWTWKVIQHEGFHQFADQVIGGRRPVWLNEGIAEYFEESLFTGDGFQSGALPHDRVRRIQLSINSGAFPALQEMMLMQQTEWNADIKRVNYDMAWAMVHFLAHGDDGKYQKPFERYMIAIGRGQDWQDAWIHQFGSLDGFEKAWKTYWLALEPNAAADWYRQAAIAGLTSYLARANAAGQSFEKFETFTTAVRTDAIEMQNNDALPPSLARNIFNWWPNDVAGQLAKGTGNAQVIIVTPPDGNVVIGSYTLRGKTVKQVNVTIDPLPRLIAQAEEMITADDKPAARRLLLEAIREHRRSRFVKDARALLPKTF